MMIPSSPSMPSSAIRMMLLVSVMKWVALSELTKDSSMSLMIICSSSHSGCICCSSTCSSLGFGWFLCTRRCRLSEDLLLKGRSQNSHSNSPASLPWVLSKCFVSRRWDSNCVLQMSHLQGQHKNLVYIGALIDDNIYASKNATKNCHNGKKT